ncbi:uncharacterized protein ColSpa_12205 [Colletotrichum spaethianum]|uniref:Uncharacterized protein n=1 Tax=Colletotrichum spaethianum TaxID=700344 RepID=A0AA37PGX8_9PEZI|nr:uncharacterized protein ColSpa_12205 [Colletotrichum spaethianum]GKT52024.1 hypothetical protein ColSpa_12205 [Colletotrichum spaethianum]
MAIRCEGRFLWLMMQEPTLRKAFTLRPLTVCEITDAALIDDSEDLPLEDLHDALDVDYIETEIDGLCSPLLMLRASRQAQP